MFAISYEIDNVSLEQQEQIRQLMGKYGFNQVYSNMYLTKDQDLVSLFQVINELKKVDWFSEIVHNICGYRVENWSDFTQFMKE